MVRLLVYEFELRLRLHCLNSEVVGLGEALTFLPFGPWDGLE